MPIRVLLVLLIIVAIVANLITPYVFDRHLQISISNRMFECLGAFFFGLKFSEISLLGFALAYLPMPRFQRATLIFGLTCLLVIAFMIGLRAWPGMPIQAAIMLSVGSLGGVSLVGALAVVLKRSGWRIQHQDCTQATEKQSSQFSMRFLLYVMTGVGLLTSLLKIALPKESQSMPIATLVGMSLWLLWLFISLSVILLLTALATLNQNPRRSRIALMLLVIFGPFLFQIVARIVLIGVPGSRLAFSVQSFAIVYSVLAGILVGMGLVFFALRRLGYRLNKIP
ncbi:MAG: hypothetical protein MUC83_14605 [Pirellula sp.]|jgi:hypothetical protein|nr:hypothetical protein [Pirellula sp.]